MPWAARSTQSPNRRVPGASQIHVDAPDPVDTRRRRPQPRRPGAASAARQRDAPRALPGRRRPGATPRPGRVQRARRRARPRSGAARADLRSRHERSRQRRPRAGAGPPAARTSAGDVVAVPSDHGACFELRMPAIAPWRGDAGEDRGQDGAANPRTASRSGTGRTGRKRTVRNESAHPAAPLPVSLWSNDR